jgi:uncharacterized protein YjbI with pentapeptide repeats
MEKPFFNQSFWDFRNKTFFDWLEVVLVPVVIAVGGFLYSQQQKAQDIVQQQNAEQSADIARQHEVMSNYLTRMTNLLIKQNLRLSPENSEERIIARAITLNAARQLEDERKGQLIKFLYEAKLIGHCPSGENLNTSDNCIRPIFNLESAILEKTSFEGSMPSLEGIDLKEAVLSSAQLSGITLTKAKMQKVDLRGADLTKAFMVEVDLAGAKLERIDLKGAVLSKANLKGAQIKNGNLQCSLLRGTELQEANLEKANLSNADLNSAQLGVNSVGEKTNLKDANLKGANLLNVDLRETRLQSTNLEGAIFNQYTQFPNDFDPFSAGMRQVQSEDGNRKISQLCNLV